MTNKNDEQLNIANLQDTMPDKESATYSNTFNISWLGSSGVTNSAVVEQTDYDGKGLHIEFIVSGTPALQTACIITVIPKNCELKSDDSKVSVEVDGGNLNKTFIRDITPKASYKGKTVKFAVSILGPQGAVFYVRGDIGKLNFKET